MGLSIAHISPAGADPEPGPANPTRYYAGPEATPYILQSGEGLTDAEIQATWATDPRRPVEYHDPITDPRLTVARHGNLMKLHGSTRDGLALGGGRRGVVTGYSRQSRARLMELVASVDRRVPASLWLFVTLTYPGVYSDDPAEWKRHLDILFKRLLRAYPTCCALWRLEFQQRGAPHYHLLLCGLAYLDYRWLREAWYQIVASGDDKHLRAGTRVEAIRSYGGVTHYASKYVGKVDPNAPKIKTGRIWGIHNRQALPVATLDLPLVWAEFHQLRRLMRRWARGSKALPWCRGPPETRRWQPGKVRSRNAGAKLFVAEAVCYRILRGLPTLTQMDTDPPELGTNRRFRGLPSKDMD